MKTFIALLFVAVDYYLFMHVCLIFLIATLLPGILLFLNIWLPSQLSAFLQMSLKRCNTGKTYHKVSAKLNYEFSATARLQGNRSHPKKCFLFINQTLGYDLLIGIVSAAFIQ